MIKEVWTHAKKVIEGTKKNTQNNLKGIYWTIISLQIWSLTKTFLSHSKNININHKDSIMITKLTAIPKVIHSLNT